MSDRKKPTLDHPVHDLIAQRWSPYLFSDRAVEPAVLRSLFEAVRWAPSSYNGQPWRFLVATKDDPREHEKLASCLVDANRAWAENAPVLVLTVVAENYSHNGAPNTAAEHDLGQAAAYLTIEATARGLSVHQMGGILPDRAREIYGVPEGYHVMTAIAVGHATDTGADEHVRRDATPRTRLAQSEFVFGGEFGRAFTGDG